MKTIIKIMTVAFVAMMLPATVLQAGNGPNDPRIATDKSTYYVGDKVTVTVSNTLGGNIFVHYCLLEGRYSATDPSKKWQMNKDSDTKHWFGPMSDAWNGKWLKIIAENRSKGTWSDEIYMQIQAKPQSGPTPPTHQQTQTKPRITLPSNRSSSTHGSQLNVTVSGNNIEVTYVGLNGEPNPSNTNESQNGFYTGKMYSSGNNKFYFTPNTSAWQNKWVKIIACDKSTNLWSDPVYVKIDFVGPPPPAQTKPRITLPSDRSSSTHGNQLNVVVSGNNIEVTYVGLNGEPNPLNTNESQNGFYTGKMYSSGNNKFYFTPNTSAWQNKWVKIIACDKSTNLWSDPVYVKIDFVGPPPPAQTKPRITSPSDRSSSTFEKDVNVTVSGNNIEVTYVGLNGEPNPSNTNESQNGFYTGKMYSSGNNKFYFTPNTSAWQNKWVKIIACDKSTNLWSDPVYVKILGSTPPKSEHGIEILSDKDYSSAFASTAYNPRLAYWCAKAAKDAYDNSNETMKLLGFNPEKLDLAEFDIPVYMLVGMKMTKINVSVGLRGYIGKTTVNGENVVMIAIRGSKTTSNWLSDFNAYPYSWKTELPSIPDNVIPDDNTFSKWIPFLSQASPEAHGGFFLCTQKIWNKIPAHYKNTNNLFIVTGHSLGGAISELLCLKLKDANVPVNNIISYGFASPPVGDEDLRNHAGNLKSKIIKIKSNNDVVPNAGIFAFTLANQVGTITFSDKWAIDIPGNHSMDRYLQEISNLKPPRFTNDFKTVSYSSTPMNQPQSQNSNTSNAPAQPIGTNSNTVTPITTSNSQESTNTNNPNTRGSQVGQRRQGNTNQQQPQTKPLITSPSDRSTFILGNQLDVTVSGNNIEVMYSGLTGNPNPPNENESNFYKGTMYSSCNNNFFFTPNTSTWENKWVKIIARDKNTNLWSDPVYVQILPKQNNQQQQQANNLFQTAQQQQQSENKTSNVPVQSMTIEGNTVSRTTSLYQQENTNARERQDSRQPQRGNTNQQQQQQQTKPQITSPSDRSSIVVGSQLSVTVSGDNIEVTYTGLTGDPNPSNKNERSFERRTMSLSGNNTFFFTPNGLTWENRWVKIVARDKNTNLLSDPVYVKIEQNNQQRGRNQQRDNDNQEDNRRQRGNNNNRR